MVDFDIFFKICRTIRRIVRLQIMFRIICRMRCIMWRILRYLSIWLNKKPRANYIRVVEINYVYIPETLTFFSVRCTRL